MSVRQPTKVEQCFSFLLKRKFFCYFRSDIPGVTFCFTFAELYLYQNIVKFQNIMTKIAEFTNHPCKSYTTKDVPKVHLRI